MMNNYSPDEQALDLKYRENQENLISINERLARQRHIKPNVLQMAINLLETVREVAKAEGKLLVSQEEQQERLKICLECDQLWLPEEGKGGAKCCECGCFIQLKIPVKAADCPLKKWPLM
ncbi:MAG TPA: DUF6171 family protein [Waterburya sp.]|jgi:hypothetical protein